MNIHSASALDPSSVHLLASPDLPLSATPLPASGSRSAALLFIDSSISGYQTLAAGSAPGTEVHILNSHQDAVTQITNALLGREGISSLHVISHGAAGGLDFGAGKLTLSDLPSFASQIQSGASQSCKSHIENCPFR